MAFLPNPLSGARVIDMDIDQSAWLMGSITLATLLTLTLFTWAWFHTRGIDYGSLWERIKTRSKVPNRVRVEPPTNQTVD